MNAHQALMLVREKFLEEQNGITDGKTTEKYKNACEKFPVQMTTAHYVWAMEFSKGMGGT